MNNLTGVNFATRPTVMLELPLGKNTRIMHPERVLLKIGDKYHDFGAFCYALRSYEKRKQLQPREVVLDSFLKQRSTQILRLINALSCLATDGGKRIATVQSHATYFRSFLDWADAEGLHDCLSGGDATRHAYRVWAEDTRERYRRQEFGEHTHNIRLVYIRELLEATTGLENLQCSIAKLKNAGIPMALRNP